MPESEDNQNLGMFMISLNVMSMDKELMVHSRRPAMMRYYSMPIRLATTFLYAVPYLAGIALERQRLRIPLLAKWRPNAEAKAALYTLTPHKPNTHMQLYSAYACIDTDLRGFRCETRPKFLRTAFAHSTTAQLPGISLVHQYHNSEHYFAAGAYPPVWRVEATLTLDSLFCSS